MLTNEGPGARVIELAKTFQEESNPFLSSSDANPFSGASSSANVSATVQPKDSGNDWVDLLTGEGPCFDQTAQPAKGSVVDNGGDLLDFLDQAVVEYHGSEADNKLSSRHDGRTSENSSQLYINSLKSLAGTQLVCYDLTCLFHCITMHFILNFFFFFLEKKNSQSFMKSFFKKFINYHFFCGLRLLSFLGLISL